ncbi:hypothetical protein [Planktotalea sp.]|uniref:hypothetical protein n=1 Tax=Planktotalea sp. TaxID=2029877 RepID=UPI003D6B3F06
MWLPKLKLAPTIAEQRDDRRVPQIDYDLLFSLPPSEGLPLEWALDHTRNTMGAVS